MPPYEELDKPTSLPEETTPLGKPEKLPVVSLEKLSESEIDHKVKKPSEVIPEKDEVIPEKEITEENVSEKDKSITEFKAEVETDGKLVVPKEAISPAETDIDQDSTVDKTKLSEVDINTRGMGIDELEKTKLDVDITIPEKGIVETVPDKRTEKSDLQIEPKEKVEMQIEPKTQSLEQVKEKTELEILPKDLAPQNYKESMDLVVVSKDSDIEIPELIEEKEEASLNEKIDVEDRAESPTLYVTVREKDVYDVIDDYEKSAATVEVYPEIPVSTTEREIVTLHEKIELEETPESPTFSVTVQEKEIYDYIDDKEVHTFTYEEFPDLAEVQEKTDLSVHEKIDIDKKPHIIEKPAFQATSQDVELEEILEIPECDIAAPVPEIITIYRDTIPSQARMQDIGATEALFKETGAAQEATSLIDDSTDAMKSHEDVLRPNMEKLGEEKVGVDFQILPKDQESPEKIEKAEIELSEKELEMEKFSPVTPTTEVDDLKIDTDSKVKETESTEKAKLDTHILDAKVDRDGKIPDKWAQRVDFEIEPKGVPKTEVESTEVQIKPKEKDLNILEKKSEKTALEIQPKGTDKQYQEKLDFEIIHQEDTDIPKKTEEEHPEISSPTDEREIHSLKEKIDLGETPESPTFSITVGEKETYDVIDDQEVSTFSFEEYPEFPEIPEKSEVSVHEKIDIVETSDSKQQPTVKSITEEAMEVESEEKPKVICSDEELKIDIDSKTKEPKITEKTRLDTHIVDAKGDKVDEVPDEKIQKVDLQIEPKIVPGTEVTTAEIQIESKEKDDMESEKTALKIQSKDTDKQYQEKLDFEIIPQEYTDIPKKTEEEYPEISSSTEEREIETFKEKIDLDETPESPTFSITVGEKETYDVIDDQEISTFSFEEYPEIPEIPEKSEVSVHEKIDIDETSDSKQQPTIKPISEEAMEVESEEKPKAISSDEELKIDIDSKTKEPKISEKTRLDTRIVDTKGGKVDEVPDEEIQRVDLQIEPKIVPGTEVETVEIQIESKEKDNKESEKTALKIQSKITDKQYQEKLDFEIIPQEDTDIPKKTEEEYPEISSSTEEREIETFKEKIDLGETPESPTFSVTVGEKETYDVIGDQEVSTVSFEEYPEFPEIPEKSEVSVHEKIDIDETSDSRQPTIKPITEEAMEVESEEKPKVIPSDEELKIDTDSKTNEPKITETIKLDIRIVDAKGGKVDEVPDEEIQRVDLQIEPKIVPGTKVETAEIQIESKEKDDKESEKTALKIQPKDTDKQYQEKLDFEIIPQKDTDIPKKTEEEYPEISSFTEKREIETFKEKIDLGETPESPTFSITEGEKETYDVIDDQDVSTFSFEEYPEIPEIPEKSEVSVHEKIDIDETSDSRQQPTIKPITEEAMEVESEGKPKVISSDEELKIDIDSKTKEPNVTEKTRLDTHIVDAKGGKVDEVPDEEIQRVDLQIEPKIVPGTEVETAAIQIESKENDDKESEKTALKIQSKDIDKQYQEKLDFEVIPQEDTDIPKKTKEEYPEISSSAEEREIETFKEKIDLGETPESPTFSVTVGEKETYDVIDDQEVSTFSFEEYPEIPEIPEKSEVSVHEKIDIDETSDSRQQLTIKSITEEAMEVESEGKPKVISSDELKIDIDSKTKEPKITEKTRLDTHIVDAKGDKVDEVPDEKIQRVDLQIEPKIVPGTEVETAEIQIESKEKDDKESEKTALKIQSKDTDKQYQEKLDFEIIPQEDMDIPKKTEEEYPEIVSSTEEREVETFKEKIGLGETPESPTFSVTVGEKETYDVINDQEVSTFSFEEYPEIPEIPEKSEVSVREKIDIDETSDSKQQPTIKPIKEEAMVVESEEKPKVISSDEELKIDIDSKTKEPKVTEKTRLDTHIVDAKGGKVDEVPDEEIQRVDLQIEPKIVPGTEVETAAIQIESKEKDHKESEKPALKIQSKDTDKQYQEKLVFEVIPQEDTDISRKTKEEYPEISSSAEEREIETFKEKIDLGETPESPTFSVTVGEKETYDVIDDQEVSTFSFEEYPEIPEIPEKSEVSVHEKIDIDETSDSRQQPTISIKPITEEAIEVESEGKPKVISSDELKIDIDSKTKEPNIIEKTRLDTRIVDAKGGKVDDVPDEEIQRVDLQIEPKIVPRTEVETAEIQIESNEKDDKESEKTALKIQSKDTDKQYQEKLDFEIILQADTDIPKKTEEEYPEISSSTEEREIETFKEKIDLGETPESPTFSVTVGEKETYDVIDDQEVSTFSFEEYPEIPEIPEKSEVSVHEKIDIDETSDSRQQPTIKPITEEAMEVESEGKPKVISSDELKIDIDSKTKEPKITEKTRLDTHIVDAKGGKVDEVPDEEIQRVDLQIEPKIVPRTEVETAEIQIESKEKDHKESEKTALKIQSKDTDKQYQEKLEFEIIPQEDTDIPKKTEEEYPEIVSSTEEREIETFKEKIGLGDTPESPTFSVTVGEKETYDVIDDQEVSTFSFEEYPEIPEIPEKSEVSVHEKIDIDETSDSKQQPTIKPISEEAMVVESEEKPKVISSDEELKIDIDSKTKEPKVTEKTRLDTHIVDAKGGKVDEVPDEEIQRVDLQIEPKIVPGTEVETAEIQIESKEKDHKESEKRALKIQSKDTDKQYQEKLDFEIIPQEDTDIPKKTEEEYPEISSSTEEREIESFKEKIDLGETPESPTFSVTVGEKETYDVIDDQEVSTVSFEEYPEFPEIPEKSEVSVHEKIDIDETSDSKQQPTIKPISEEAMEVESEEKTKVISSDEELKIDIDSKTKEPKITEKTRLDTHIVDAKGGKVDEVPDEEIQRVDLQIEPKIVPGTEVETVEIQIESKEKDDKESEKTALEIQSKDTDKQYQEKLDFEIIPQEDTDIPKKTEEEYPEISSSTEEREIETFKEKIDLGETPESPTFSVTVGEKETYDVIDDQEVSTFSFEEYPEIPEIPEKSEVSVHEKIDIDETSDSKQQPTIKPISEEAMVVESEEKRKVISSDEELKVDIDSKRKEPKVTEKTRLDTHIVDAKGGKVDEVPDEEIQRVDLQIEPKIVPGTEVETAEIQIESKEKDHKESEKRALKIQSKDTDKQYQEKLDFEIIPQEDTDIPKKTEEEYPEISSSTEEREIESFKEKIDLGETPESPTFSVTVGEKETYDVIDDQEVSTVSFEEYPEFPEIPEKSEVSVHEKIDIDETSDSKQQPTIKPISEEAMEVESEEKTKVISSDEELKIDIDSKTKEPKITEKTRLDTHIVDAKGGKVDEVPDEEIQRVDLQIEPKIVPGTEVETVEIQIESKEKDDKESEKTALEIQSKDTDKQYQEKLDFEIIPQEDTDIPKKTEEEYPEISSSTEEREIETFKEKIDLGETPESPTFSVTVGEKETYDVIDDQEVSTFSFEEYPEIPEIPEKSEVSVHEKIDIDETSDSKQQPTIKPISEEAMVVESEEKRKVISSDEELKVDIDSKRKEPKVTEKTRLDTHIVDAKGGKVDEVPDEEIQRVDLQIEPKIVPGTEVETAEIQIESKEKDHKESEKRALKIQSKDTDKQYQEKLDFEIIPQEDTDIPKKTEEEYPEISSSTEEREIESFKEKIDLGETPESPTFSVTVGEKETYDVIDDQEVSTVSFEEYPEFPEIPEKSEVSVHEKIDIDETSDSKQQPTIKPISEEAMEVESEEKTKVISSDEELKIDIDSKTKEPKITEKTRLDTHIVDAKGGKVDEVPDEEIQRVDLQIEPKIVPGTEVETVEIQIESKEKDDKESEKTALEIQSKDTDKQYQEKLDFEIIPQEDTDIPKKTEEEYPEISSSTEEREIETFKEKIDLGETPESPTFSVTVGEKETYDVIDDQEVSTFSFEEYPEIPEIPEKSEVSVHEKIDIDETSDSKQQPTIKPISEEAMVVESEEKRKVISSDEELKVDIDSKRKEPKVTEKTRLDTHIVDAKGGKVDEVPDEEIQRVDLQIEPKIVPGTEVETAEIQIESKEKDHKESEKRALKIQSKDTDKQYQEKLDFEIIPQEDTDIPKKTEEECPEISSSTEEREIESFKEKIDLGETPESPTFSVTVCEKETYDVIDDQEVSTVSFEEYPEFPEIPEKSEVSVHEKIDIDETSDSKQQPTIKPISEEAMEVESEEKPKVISSDEELKIDIDSKTKEPKITEKTRLDTHIVDAKGGKVDEVPDEEIQRVDLQIEPKIVPGTEVETVEIQIESKEKDDKESEKTALEIQSKDTDKQYQEKLDFEIIPQEDTDIPKKTEEEYPEISSSTEEREIETFKEKIDLGETPESPTFSVTVGEKETYDVIDDQEVSTFSFEEYPEFPEIPEKSEISVHEKIDIGENMDSKQQLTVASVTDEAMEVDGAEMFGVISSDELKIDIDSKTKEPIMTERSKLDTQVVDAKRDKVDEVSDEKIQRVDLQIEPKKVPRTEVETAENQMIESKEKDEKKSEKTALKIQPKGIDKQYQENLDFEIIPHEYTNILKKTDEKYPEFSAPTEEREIESHKEKIDLSETQESPTFSVTVREKETYDVIDDQEVSTFSFEECPEFPKIPEQSQVSVHEKIDIDETTDTKQQPAVKPETEETMEVESVDKSKVLSSDEELKIDIDSKIKEPKITEKNKLDTQVVDAEKDNVDEVPDEIIQRIDLQIEPKKEPGREVETAEIQIESKDRDNKKSEKTVFKIQPKDTDKQYREKLDFEIIPHEDTGIAKKTEEEYLEISASAEEREIESLKEMIDLVETPESPTFSVTVREKETYDVIDDQEVSTISFEEYPEFPEIPEKSEVSVHEKIDIDETTDTDKQYKDTINFELIPQEDTDIPKKIEAEYPEISASTEVKEIEYHKEKIDLSETPESPTFSVSVHEKETCDFIDDQEVSTVSFEEYPEFPEIPEKSEVSVHEMIDIDETFDSKQQPSVKPVTEESMEIDSEEKSKVISSDEGLKIDIDSKTKEPKITKKPILDTKVVDAKGDKVDSVPEEKIQRVDLQIEPKKVSGTEIETTEIQIESKEKAEQKTEIFVLKVEPKDKDKQYLENLDLEITPEVKMDIAKKTEGEYPEMSASTEQRERESLKAKIDLGETPESQTFSITVLEKETYDVIDDQEVSTFSFEEYPEFPDIPEKSEVSVHEKIVIDETTDNEWQPRLETDSVYTQIESDEGEINAPEPEVIILFRDTIEMDKDRPQFHQIEAKESMHKVGEDLKNVESLNFIQGDKTINKQSPTVKPSLREHIDELSKVEMETYAMDMSGSAEVDFNAEVEVIALEKPDSQEFDIAAPVPEVISLLRETIKMEKVPYSLGATETSYKEATDTDKATQMIPERLTDHQRLLERTHLEQNILQANEIELIDGLEEFQEKPLEKTDKFAKEKANLDTSERDEESVYPKQLESDIIGIEEVVSESLTETLVEEEILVIPREDWTEVFVKRAEEALSDSEESDISEQSLEKEGYGIEYPDKDDSEEEIIEIPKKRRGTLTIITEDKEDMGVSYSEEIEIEETPRLKDLEGILRFEPLQEDFELVSSHEIIEIDISGQEKEPSTVKPEDGEPQDKKESIPVLERVLSEDQAYVIEYPQEVEEKGDLVSEEVSYEVEDQVKHGVTLETAETEERHILQAKEIELINELKEIPDMQLQKADELFVAQEMTNLVTAEIVPDEETKEKTQPQKSDVTGIEEIVPENLQESIVEEEILIVPREEWTEIFVKRAEGSISESDESDSSEESLEKEGYGIEYPDEDEEIIEIPQKRRGTLTIITEDKEDTGASYSEEIEIEETPALVGSPKFEPLQEDFELISSNEIIEIDISENDQEQPTVVTADEIPEYDKERIIPILEKVKSEDQEYYIQHPQDAEETEVLESVQLEEDSIYCPMEEETGENVPVKDISKVLGEEIKENEEKQTSDLLEKEADSRKEKIELSVSTDIDEVAVPAHSVDQDGVFDADITVEEAQKEVFKSEADVSIPCKEMSKTEIDIEKPDINLNITEEEGHKETILVYQDLPKQKTELTMLEEQDMLGKEVSRDDKDKDSVTKKDIKLITEHEALNAKTFEEVMEDSVISVSETPSEIKESSIEEEFLTPEVIEGPLQVTLEDVYLIKPQEVTSWAPEILEKPKKPGTW